MLHVLTVAAFILPLGIDTFVLSTALGSARIPARIRLRTSLLLTCFEGGMPVIGFLLGAALGKAVGQVGDYVGPAVLALVGLWMLRPGSEESEEAEEQRVRLLQAARVWMVIALGLSISVDEFAIGLGAGLLGLPLVVLVVLIVAQAFIAAQLGMRLGSFFAEEKRESAEKIAGGLLLVAAALIIVEKLR
jgi:putative Mn2+ efflux pump MntP